MEKGVIGYIHSVETFGAVDGPGIRYIVFTQGCPLKCQYCHNPDTWQINIGKQVYSGDVVGEILEYKNFIKSGGVTISGGEPLIQPEFVKDIIQKCKKEGIHTAIDTAGSVSLEISREVINEADMLLLDIKALDDVVCTDLTGFSNINTLKTLEYCESINKTVWIRHVLVPGITLKWKLLENLADYLTKFTCIENIELLPFHKMGEFKWKKLNLDYKLYDTLQPEQSDILMAKEIFLSRNLPVKK